MKTPSAKTALKIVKSVSDSLGSEYAAYLVGPNVVLTLAGCRPAADVVSYSDDSNLRKQWNSELQTLFSFLRKFELTWYEIDESVNPMGNPYVAAEFFFQNRLDWVFDQTKLLDTTQKFALQNNILPTKLIAAIAKVLAEGRNKDRYSKEVYGHIATGIVLGYPDEAIISFADYYESESEKFVDAKIEYGDRYSCPQPVYQYIEKLSGSPAIKQHEQLWSTVLDEFYSSELHSALCQDKRFQSKIAELDN